MTNQFKTLMVILGVVALTTACGTAIPTASSPDLASGESVSSGAPTELFTGPGRVPPQPEECAAQLVLTKVASSKVSVSIQAIWMGKVEKFPVACGTAVWTVSPEAKTIVRRFEPNVITVLGQLGAGYLVTATAAGQQAHMKVAIGE